MNKIIMHETYGKIEYNESFWTGKKELSVNDVPLQKVSKKVFSMSDGTQIAIEGNFLGGLTLNIGNERLQLTDKIKWYEIVLSIIPFILIMVWSNVPYLFNIFPVVGGAIGGAISAVFVVGNLFIIKNVKNIWLKIVISIAMLAATFLVCWLIALAIISVAN